MKTPATSKNISSKSASTRAGKTNPLGPILDQKELPKVSLICSEDEVRLERAIAMIVEHFAEVSAAKIEQRVVHGRDLNFDALQKLASSVGVLSLFSSQQLLIIKQGEQIPASALKRLAEILPRFTSTEALLVTAGDLPNSHPIAHFCSKNKTLIKLERPKGHDLSRWVERELRRTGLTEYTDQVIQALIAVGDGSLDAIVRSVEQLSLYVNDTAVSSQDVHTLFVHHTVPGEFEMVDAIAEGKVLAAEIGMTSLLRQGKSAFMLLAILSRTFSNYILVKALLTQGISAGDARAKIGMSPWLFQKVVHAIRRYSFDGLLQCLQAILKADTKLKGRSLGEEAVMSQLVYDLVVPVRG